MGNERLEIFASCQARVRKPGKFEGEDPCVAYYYDATLDGGGETIFDAEDPETPVDLFVVSDDDRATFPELRTVHAVMIWTTVQGSVCSRYFTTEAELDVVRAANNTAWDALDENEGDDPNA